MFPSWSRQLIVRGVILASVCLMIMGGVWAVNGGLRQDQDGSRKSGSSDPTPNANVADANPSKPATEAAPGVSKPADKVAASGEGKSISLIEAISLVEKTGKGLVVKAERIGEGTSVQFNVDVLGTDRTQTHFNVNATGKVIVENTQSVKNSTGKKSGERSGKGRERKRDDD